MKSKNLTSRSSVLSGVVTHSLWATALLAGCSTFSSPPAAVATPPEAAPAPGAMASAPAPRFASTTATAAAAVASAASAPVVGAVTPPRPDPTAARPFDDVIKGATQQAGFVPVWRKDEKVWLEIAVDRFDTPFNLSVNVSNSVGERGLYGSMMGPNWMAQFRKIGSTQVQLIALNTAYVASSAAMKATLEQSFSHSLLGSAVIASAAHPTRKSVLIDASFLLSDIAGYSTQLEQAFRIPYGLDRGNSYFEKTRVSDDLTTLNTRIHFATARIAAAPLVPGPVPVPPPPSAVPDPRSFFVGFVYSFSKLPEQAMTPRKTDPRLGHFFDLVTDLTSDLKSNPRLHYVNRWRLEKKDPSAALSEPKEPIVYWLDKNVPTQYRAAVTAGILEWNKAFEKIGFKNAVQAKQQPDDADWDNLDAKHASIRWFTGADVGFARGPNHSDPRTGEILDADIAMSDVFGRGSRRFIVEDVAASHQHKVKSWQAGAKHNLHSEHCDYAHEAASEMDFALDLLEARGDLEPDSPEAEAFVQSVVKDTITHEVGHTLGLKHNFKGSTVVSRTQLQDAGYTEANGISGSVMDYNAYNLPVAGERKASFNNSTIGPYDYWAIEYAYRPLNPATEAADLERIASRSTEPLLAYADDADAGGGRGNDGIDPLVNRFDLGDDPLAYYQKRLQLSRELWQRVQDRAPRAGEDAQRQRRVLLSGFRQLGRSTELVGKYVGGMYTQRDQPGPNQRPAYTPVEPAKQRDALQFLAKGLFASDSFKFKPQFLAGLTPDYNEWDRGGPVNIPGVVLQMQTVALDRLLSAGTASRLLDLPSYLSSANSRNIISLPEVYSTVQSSVWSELKGGAEIDRMRRNLQREHLKRVQSLLTRGSASLPPDALSLVRMNATELQADLRRAAGNGKLSIESRAHLQDSLSQITEALRASMVRG
jgi:Met-zincin/Domain of unknown function (DUF5117)